MLDVIGCPINIGDTVLVAGYSSSAMNTIAIIEKVNKSSITVVLKASRWDYENQKYFKEDTKMRRKSYQVIVINQQLAYIQENFPENLI